MGNGLPIAEQAAPAPAWYFGSPMRSSVMVLALVVACGSRGAEAPQPEPDLECQRSRPLEVGRKPTGLGVCSNGMTHRPSAVTCPSWLPRGDGEPSDPAILGKGNECRRDADCTALPYGHCELTLPPIGNSNDPDDLWRHCAYGCERDGDCRHGQICFCAAPVGYCVRASCRTDADCEAPFVCGGYMPDQGMCETSIAFACQTERDECAQSCFHNGDLHCGFAEDHRVCGVSCGRP